MKKLIITAILFFALVCLAVNTISEVESTHPNGRKKKEVTFEIQDSIYYPIRTARFDSTGFAIDVKTYKDSLLHGNCINYRKGSLYINIPYKRGKIHGTLKVYYPSGQLNFSMKYRAGIKHGKVKVYYEDGTLQKIFSFKNGVQHGKYTGYYPNGIIEISGRRRFENPTGKFVKYFSNGQIEKKGKYKHYKKSAKWLKFNEDGNLIEYNYHNKNKPEIKSFTYYPDKTIKAEGFYIGDQRVGIWHTFFRSGELKEIAVYDSIVTDNPFGTCEEYWEGTKKIRFKGFRRNESLDSLWVEYDSLGVKLIEQNYFVGNLSGLSTTFYCDGTISEQGVFVLNKKNGIWKKYDENGSVIDETRHQAQINHTTGEYRYYYDSGALKAKYFYVGSQREKISYDYYEDGSIRSIDDRIHDIRRSFFPNGKLKSEEHLAKYNKGFFRSTLIKEFYENGNLKKEIISMPPGHFTSNKSIKEYFESGKIKSYKDKDTHGKYFKNGNLYMTYEMKNGKKNGLFQQFDKQTNSVICTCYYIDNKKHGEEKQFHDNGSLRLVSNYINGKRDGVYESYYPNGQLRTKIEYLDDKKEGEFTQYYDSGVIEHKCSYRLDRKIGDAITYDENDNIINKEFFENEKR